MSGANCYHYKLYIHLEKGHSWNPEMQTHKDQRLLLYLGAAEPKQGLLASL